jgi:hypothetical protein
MKIEVHTLFSVKGGKFHRPSEPFDRAKAFRETATKCGLNVTPLNYFRSDDDADRHTGGRLSRHLCKRCAP